MSRAVMQQALEALQERYSGPLRDRAIEALEEALGAPEPEPVAWINVTDRKLEWSRGVQWETATTGVYDRIPLYINPTQCKPLTDEQIHDCFQQRSTNAKEYRRLITRAIERAHGIE